MLEVGVARIEMLSGHGDKYFDDRMPDAVRLFLQVLRSWD